jgi:glycosyltransferase involved in cell wall biosynthesis
VDLGIAAKVIALPGLPSDVHAALFLLARLTIVPTFFEGGFPFPFCESLSLGVPVVMSAIPVTRDVIPASLHPLVLFDPYSVDEMAQRMDWALDHRDELLSLELPVDRALRRRTWDDVAAEYVDVLGSA